MQLQEEQEHSHVDHTTNGSIVSLAVSATLHCLTGCVIGETIGLMLGVSLQWHPLQTAIIATALAFITGFALTLVPMVLKKGMSISETFRIVWLGETLSIGIMELTMNIVDFLAGGMQVQSISEPIFWYSLIAAIIAGFMAGFPVNYVMIKKNIKKKCH